MNAFFRGGKKSAVLCCFFCVWGFFSPHEESAVYSIMSATVKDSIKTFSTEPS